MKSTSLKVQLTSFSAITEELSVRDNSSTKRKVFEYGYLLEGVISMLRNIYALSESIDFY